VDIYTGELELKISDSTLPGSSLSVTRWFPWFSDYLQIKETTFSLQHICTNRNKLLKLVQFATTQKLKGSGNFNWLVPYLISSILQIIIKKLHYIKLKVF
jgi:hypothetical protein